MSVGARAYGHAHGETFMLMQYETARPSGPFAAADDPRHDAPFIREVIWNSRDGVTPFCITAMDGVTELQHVRWFEDVYAPDHVPQLGERMFVDITVDRARAAARRNAQKWWDEDADWSPRKRFATVEEFEAVLAEGYYTPGGPDLIVVAG